MITQQQKTSFYEGGGSDMFFTADHMLLAVQGIGITFLLLFVAWACVKVYSEYGNGDSKADDVLIVWARAVFIFLVMIYILSPTSKIFN